MGLDAKGRAYDFGAWFERLTRGGFALSLGWSQEGATPYDFYGGLMSERAVKPLGESAPSNWHRHASRRASDALAAFEATADEAERRRLMAEVQRAFADEVPAIPLFPSPSWGECSTRRFTGWPGPDDPYARLSPHAGAEALIVMTRVEAIR